MARQLDRVGPNGTPIEPTWYSWTQMETKLASDEMLILQGLDYWVWATRDDNAAWLRDRLARWPGQPSLLIARSCGR